MIYYASKNESISKWGFAYSFIIALLPYLDLFPSRIFKPFTLAFSACCVLVVGSFISKALKHERTALNRFDFPLLFFLIYIGMTNIFSNLLMPDLSETTGYFSSFSTIFFVITLVCFFNYDNWKNCVVQKVVLVISLIATIGIFGQVVSFYLLGTYLKVIPIEFMTDSIQREYFRLFTNSMEGSLFRPCSIFLEPSYYCEYVVCALAWTLFVAAKGKNKYWYAIAILLSLGMVFTTSGMGIFMVAVCWFFHILHISAGKFSASTLIMYLLILVCCIFFVSQSNTLDRSIGRFFSSQAGFHSARFSDISYFFNLNFFHQVFGLGYGREPEKVYFTNLFCFLIRIGWIGVVWFGWIIMRWHKKSNQYGKLFIPCYIVIFVTSGTYTFFYFVFYLSLIQSSELGEQLSNKADNFEVIKYGI